MVNVCGNHLWCCTDEETALSTSAGVGCSIDLTKNVSSSGRYCKWLRSITGVILHAGIRRLHGLGRDLEAATDYSADTNDVD